eukprot:g1170.t1
MRYYLGAIALLCAIIAMRGDEKNIKRETFVKERDEIRLTILTTNDLHSAVHNYEDLYSYISKTQKDASKRERDVVLTLDGGDWFSGSMYDKLSTSKNHGTPQLEFFSLAGYDAVILGNHEFDAGEDGLYTMVSGHRSFDGKSIPILSSDLEVSADSQLNELFDRRASDDPVNGTRIQPFLVKRYDVGNHRDFVVGLVGVMGLDSALLCQHSRRSMQYSGFSDSTGRVRMDRLVTRLQGTVRRMRDEFACDVVVGIAHSGGDEVRRIAAAVDGIDVMIGGHTHEKQFFDDASTATSFISQCGSDGVAVGHLELDVSLDVPATSSTTARVRLSRASKDRVSSEGSICVDLAEIRRARDLEVETTNAISSRVKEWRAQLERSFLGRDPNLVVYEGPDGDLFSSTDTRARVASVVADGILSAANARLKSDPFSARRIGGRCESSGIDLYITCPDCVRAFELPAEGDASFRMNFEEISRMLSISVDKGVHIFHMRKFAVAAIVELAEWAELFVSDTWKIATSSSMRFRKRWWGIPFVNRAVDVTIGDVPYADLPELICVGLNGYITPYFFLVERLSKGFLSNFPLDAAGRPLDAESVRALVSSSGSLVSETDLFVEYLLAGREDGGEAGE